MGQMVVITGLADGMGRHVAKMLAKAGHSVAGFDMDAKGIASLAAELKGIGGDHLLETIDITDRPAILKFRDQVLARYGRVDTVLSNVGIGFFSPFEEANLEKALKCLEINVIGAAAIFQAFLPSMRERKSGKFIAMSSLVGRIPFPFESIYSASKFAVTGMMLSLKYEVEPFGIRVALIEPAQVSTSFAAKIHVLPPENSPYRDRARRFIERDNELIKTAPTPPAAAENIMKVIEAEKPALFNQVDFMSSFFLWLNQFLPRSLRDAILVNHMNIKV
ncbi:MAG: SDR family NAD(P)-dependent oxidoreductase [Smithellaceae bacterium]|jgi:short-subunit dehydrogenase|nr:SDR family NAD(P)-dependent oxidoreductase [Smithellaceae bacterium]MDD3260030.1 SDR family NAD(P)-dependent oxidoreductase [Smithellaceae bacterium]MDD3849197.1 SDR family NAD(P)-dependent oxidoreductase [Smithellaceae bacterium]HOQ72442.1 SDR family NAD(P)-dependent oxidoreductase [Smithellaceae bacterium]